MKDESLLHYPVEEGNDESAQESGTVAAGTASREPRAAEGGAARPLSQAATQDRQCSVATREGTCGSHWSVVHRLRESPYAPVTPRGCETFARGGTESSDSRLHTQAELRSGEDDSWTL
eukprot:3566283-Heterocapsa_arctica.AAC.1